MLLTRCYALTRCGRVQGAHAEWPPHHQSVQVGQTPVVVLVLGSSMTGPFGLTPGGGCTQSPSPVLTPSVPLLTLATRGAGVSCKWRKRSPLLSEWPHVISHSPVHVCHFWSLASPLVGHRGHFSLPDLPPYLGDEAGKRPGAGWRPGTPGPQRQPPFTRWHYARRGPVISKPQQAKAVPTRSCKSGWQSAGI